MSFLTVNLGLPVPILPLHPFPTDGPTTGQNLAVDSFGLASIMSLKYMNLNVFRWDMLFFSADPQAPTPCYTLNSATHTHTQLHLLVPQRPTQDGLSLTHHHHHLGQLLGSESLGAFGRQG